MRGRGTKNPRKRKSDTGVSTDGQPTIGHSEGSSRPPRRLAALNNQAILQGSGGVNHDAEQETQNTPILLEGLHVTENNHMNSDPGTDVAGDQDIPIGLGHLQGLIQRAFDAGVAAGQARLTTNSNEVRTIIADGQIDIAQSATDSVNTTHQAMVNAHASNQSTLTLPEQAACTVSAKDKESTGNTTSTGQVMDIGVSSNAITSLLSATTVAASLQTKDDVSNTTCLTFSSASIPLERRVTQKIKQKIWANEFIDISSILAKEDNIYNLQLKTGRDGTSSLQWSAKDKKTFITIEQWTNLFHVYLSVYCERNPEHLQHLLKYVSLVRKLADQNADWYHYDTQFRHLRANDPNMGWDSIEWELWHEAVRRGQLRQGQGQQGFCFRYQQNRACNSNCRYVHSCQNCGGPHPAINCTRQNQNFGARSNYQYNGPRFQNQTTSNYRSNSYQQTAYVKPQSAGNYSFRAQFRNPTPHNQYNSVRQQYPSQSRYYKYNKPN